jgi:hypothetical protein
LLNGNSKARSLPDAHPMVHGLLEGIKAAEEDLLELLECVEQLGLDVLRKIIERLFD